MIGKDVILAYNALLLLGFYLYKNIASGVTTTSVHYVTNLLTAQVEMPSCGRN